MPDSEFFDRIIRERDRAIDRELELKRRLITERNGRTYLSKRISAELHECGYCGSELKVQGYVAPKECWSCKSDVQWEPPSRSQK
jgi:hypothetical protein